MRLSTGPDRVALQEAHADIVAFFDRFAADEPRWQRRTGSYHRLVERVYRFVVPAGASVLEIGSGSGGLLASLQPSRGVGVDISPKMVDLARRRHPDLEFRVEAGELLDLGETFDYIILSDLLPYVHDLHALFEHVRRHSHSRTRVVVNIYSQLWRPLLAVAVWLRLKPTKPIRNWVSPGDVVNLFELAGLEAVSSTSRILMPAQVPVLTGFLNGFVANLWPFNHFCLSRWIVARPTATPLGNPSVSVICPCRNESGHVAGIVERLPEMGSSSELIFVEGGSTDDTRAAIERQIELHPDRSIRLLGQKGKGKGDAVRTGFAAAENDVLMILDGDLSVLPEDLPKFFEALAQGRAEFVNGSRLVYDMEPGAMRLLNMLGNKSFSFLFRAITGHRVKDTLCGTKVLLRADYDRIARERSYFGDFDPFGDFDLLFGAARLNLKITDLPVRYHPRTYGTTNISRFRHGLLLLRMTCFAFWKFRVTPVTRG